MITDLIAYVQGTRDMLMHTSAAMNPRNPILATMAPIKGRRGKSKTETVVESMEKADWLSSGIWGDLGETWLEEEEFKWQGYGTPVLPAEYVCRACQKAGTATKSGTKVKQALSEGLISESPIDYDGPTDALEMWSDPQCRYIDSRSVVVQRNRIMRTRVRIPSGWKAQVHLTLDTSILSISEFKDILVDSGRREGVGDYRPKFGRFSVLSLETA